jgi:hypothetical protein
MTTRGRVDESATRTTPGSIPDRLELHHFVKRRSRFLNDCNQERKTVTLMAVLVDVD